ncbi:hypothetical protein [Duganella sp. Root1480D1]|uniref:hypothetical protein n=1 Tax=Duganella sp. Root1480D1 TaxID=1736471 RepID=UPI0012E3D234|nr:hypothetical protein [Duganella sp. Root1480D1]
MKFVVPFALMISGALMAGCNGSSYELEAAKKKIAELEAENQNLKAHAAGSTQKPAAGSDAKAGEDNSGKQWDYTASEDKMSGGTTYFASVKSTNTVNFDSPYRGEQHATLDLRIDPKYGKDMIFSIERGQLLCRSYQACSVLVRFDNGKPTKYSANGPSDHSSKTLFISNYDQFLNSMKKAKIVRISPEVYQNGNPVFEFDVSGFSQDKFRPKS